MEEGRAYGLVGRERELERLASGLGDGGPVVTFVHGGPGVGKSALLAALAARATAGGVDVARIECRDVEPTPRAFLDALGRGQAQQLVDLLAADGLLVHEQVGELVQLGLVRAQQADGLLFGLPQQPGHLPVDDGLGGLGVRPAGQAGTAGWTGWPNSTNSAGRTPPSRPGTPDRRRAAGRGSGSSHPQTPPKVVVGSRSCRDRGVMRPECRFRLGPSSGLHEVGSVSR